MSRPFAKYSAKVAFGQINESMTSSDYIAKKKSMYSFCAPNQCQPNPNLYSYQKLYNIQQANQLAFYPCKQFNRNQLYSNLYTKLDLSEISPTVPVISDLSGNVFPVTIDTTVEPFLKYVIDPEGVLFGNTPCGIDNYRRFVVLNTRTI